MSWPRDPNVARAAQRLPVPGDPEGRGTAAEELCKLREGPALALIAGVALPVEAALAKEKIKAAAIFAVEGLHTGFGV